jgi:hypothetical protein
MTTGSASMPLVCDGEALGTTITNKAKLWLQEAICHTPVCTVINWTMAYGWSGAFICCRCLEDFANSCSALPAQVTLIAANLSTASIIVHGKSAASGIADGEFRASGGGST